MLNSIHFVLTLFYYDGIQIFQGNDDFDRKYICLLTGETETSWEYICAPVTVNRLQAFLEGKEDLRRIFMSPDDPVLKKISIEDYSHSDFLCTDISRDDLHQDSLPEEGFFLPSNPYSQQLFSEATKENRGILEIVFDSTNSPERPVIDVPVFSGTMNFFQTLLKYAFRIVNKGNQTLLSDPNNFTLQFAGYSSGSFKAKFQTKIPANLVGEGSLNKSIDLVNKLVEADRQEERVIELANSFRGHFLRSYVRLLDFIISQKKSIKYIWVDPSTPSEKYHGITVGLAEKQREYLARVEDLGVEDLCVLGRFTKADTASKSWRIETVDGKQRFHGKVKSDAQVSLDGVVMETQVYSCSLEERVEEEIGTGREKKTYLLKRIELPGTSS